MHSNAAFRPMPVQGPCTVNCRLRSYMDSSMKTIQSGCRDHDALFVMAADNRPQERANCEPVVMTSTTFSTMVKERGLLNIKPRDVRFLGVSANAVAPGVGGRIPNVAVLVKGGCNVRNTSTHPIELSETVAAYCDGAHCWIGPYREADKANMLRIVGVAMQSCNAGESFGIVLTQAV